MKLPFLAVPAAVLLMGAAAFPLKEAFNAPAATLSREQNMPVEQGLLKQVELTVQGVKCRGTANFFIGRMKPLEGIVDLQAYAADHRVVIIYDSSKIGLKQIKQAAEAPVRGRDGQWRKFFHVVEVNEID